MGLVKRDKQGIMGFEFATARRIIFGRGAVEKVAPFAGASGKRALLVTGRDTNRFDPLLVKLNDSTLEYVRVFNVCGEPTTETVLDGTRQARENRCDLVIGIGGGSVIDTGKAIAALVTNEGDLQDYLEVIGRGKPISEQPAPYVAVPTTAGTGAEVTHNSVIGSPEHRVKVSMRSPLMQPSLVVVDPLLTVSMPPPLTATTGLDALTQLIEAFVSNRANPLTDSLCREGLQRAARSLGRAYENGGDLDAREDMCVASLFSGLALANAKLGAVHGFAGPMGGMFSAPHGAICAGLLPHVIDINVRALHARAPDSPALSRYDEVAGILTDLPAARAIDGIRWIRDLHSALEIPPLHALGIVEDDFGPIVAKAKNASSMKGNPLPLSDEELLEILERAHQA